jgi:pimeloyl-ACP methyl ester carboxylesterase
MSRPAPGLSQHSISLPRGGQGSGEAFLVLPGLNLHPHRLDPLSALLTDAGAAAVAPTLTGYAAPGDPAQARVRAETWLADVDAAWSATRARLPGAEPSLLGYSLGALLGLAWARHAGVRLRRAILLAPALRLKALHRPLLRGMVTLLPGRVRIPSVSPAAYRFHPFTTVAAYRALARLERGLQPQLAAWLRGEDGASVPPLFIAAAARDELIDTRPLAALARAFPERVTLVPLAPAPRRGYPAHLGLDATTLGDREWQRLVGEIEAWLRRTADAAALSGSTASGTAGSTAGSA